MIHETVYTQANDRVAVRISNANAFLEHTITIICYKTFKYNSSCPFFGPFAAVSCVNFTNLCMFVVVTPCAFAQLHIGSEWLYAV